MAAPPVSIRDCITNLKEIFTNIASDCKLHETNDEGLFHPLGRINIEQSKYDFIKTSRTMGSMYTSWFPVLCKSKPPSEYIKYLELLRKYVVLHDHQKELQRKIQQCCQLGEQHLHAEKFLLSHNDLRPFINQFVRWMKSIAEKIDGSVLFNGTPVHESSGLLEVPVGQNKVSIQTQDDSFVVEVRTFIKNIKMNGNTSPKILLDNTSITEVLMTTKSFTSEPIFCKHLTSLLQKRYINEFAESLLWFKKIQTLLLTCNFKGNTVLTTLIQDIITVSASEQERKGREWALMRGHGLCERTEGSLQISFYASPFHLLKSEEEQARIYGAHRWITDPPKAEAEPESLSAVHKGILTLQRISWKQELPVTSQISDITKEGEALWVTKEDPQNSVLVDDGDEIMVGEEKEDHVICYSLELFPYIPMSVYFYLVSKISIYPSSGFSEMVPIQQGSLLSLISQDRTCTVEGKDEFDVALSDVNMKFIFPGPRRRAIQLCHFPFPHPRVLLAILNPIRQQILFNELIRSCTKGMKLSRSEETVQKPMVFEVTFEAPHLIRILFIKETINKVVSVDIDLNIERKISTTFSAPFESLAERFATLLTRSNNIPLSLQRLFQQE